LKKNSYNKEFTLKKKKQNKVVVYPPAMEQRADFSTPKSLLRSLVSSGSRSLCAPFIFTLSIWYDIHAAVTELRDLSDLPGRAIVAGMLLEANSRMLQYDEKTYLLNMKQTIKKKQGPERKLSHGILTQVFPAFILSFRSCKTFPRVSHVALIRWLEQTTRENLVDSELLVSGWLCKGWVVLSFALVQVVQRFSLSLILQT